MKIICKLVSILIMLCLWFTGPVISADLSGNLSIGYSLTDDDGNQSLQYERYNYYDGVSVSLNDLMYSKNNVIYSADLNNITMNNRKLLFSIYNPSRFRISAHHNKHRRIYDANESYSTKRGFTDVNGDFTLSKNLSLYTSFTNQQTSGDILYVSENLLDSLVSAEDYSYQSAMGGFSYRNDLGNVTANYTYTKYDDEIDSLYIQESHMIHLNGSTKIPGYDKQRIYGGFTYLQNSLKDFDLDLKNYHGWVGSKLYLARKYLVEYRFLYNRNSHEFRQLETDTWHHLVSVGRSWGTRLGLRVGYDYVIADDLLNRTTRNGFLVNAWIRINNALYAKVETNYYDKQTEYGTTLFGNVIFNRNKISIRYKASEDLSLSGNYSSRIKEIERLNSKVDYVRFSGNAVYKKEQLGKLSVNVSYAEGDYRNQSESTSYQFSNTTLRGTIAPYISKKLMLAVHGTVYDLGKDQDFRKTILSGDLDYSLKENWKINISVNSFNVDDYLIEDEYSGYTFVFNLVNYFEK